MPSNQKLRWRALIPLAVGISLLGMEVSRGHLVEAQWAYLAIVAMWTLACVLGLRSRSDPIILVLTSLDIGVGILLLASSAFIATGLFDAAAVLHGTLEKSAPLLIAWWSVTYFAQFHRVIIYFLLLCGGLLSASADLHGQAAMDFIILGILELAALRFSLNYLQNSTAGKTLLDRGTEETLDPVTRLALPATFEAELALVVALSDRKRAPLSVLACAIDGYAAYVGQFGYASGNKLLRSTASAIGDCLRISDTAGRWDREVMLVMLPDTTAHDAENVKDKIQRRVSLIESKDQGPVSLLFAIAEHCHGDDPLTVVEQIERMLDNSR